MLLKEPKRIVFFDTETTGLSPGTDKIVQLAYIVGTYDGDTFETEREVNVIINPEREIPKVCSDIHGITNEMADGKPVFREYAGDFMRELTKADLVVAHNFKFDMGMLYGEAQQIWDNHEMSRAWRDQTIKKSICTMLASIHLCKLPYPSGRPGYKWPKLIELHKHLFNEGFDGAHDALNDIRATVRCFIELHRRCEITIV